MPKINQQIIFIHTVRQNCDTFSSILIIFRESLNISEAYVNT